MSSAEFERWADFYKIQPFDDFHVHYRPAALIARCMSGGNVSEMLEWLQPKELYNSEESEYSEADLKTFQALGITKPPRRT